MPVYFRKKNFADFPSRTKEENLVFVAFVATRTDFLKITISIYSKLKENK